MAADATGTLDDNGASDQVAVRAGESLTVTLSVASMDEFVGGIIVERSSNGQVWEQVENETGDALLYEGTAMVPLTDTVADELVVNHSSKRQFYRVRVVDFDGDDLLYALEQVTGDAVEVILKDAKGQPILSRRDDGGIKFHAPISGPGEVGDLEISGPVILREISIGDHDNGVGLSEKVAFVEISAADIIETAAGGFGHAAGYPLVADPDGDTVITLVEAILFCDRATAAYTDGGNITVNENGGAALTGLVSAANSLGAATDKVAAFVPLAVAGRVVTKGKGLNLVSSAAFTNPGTAAGVLKVWVRYRETYLEQSA